jgi:hypothetical protein
VRTVVGWWEDGGYGRPFRPTKRRRADL